MSVVSSILGSLFCIGAGVYLLLHGSGSIQIGDQTGQSWLEIIAHGTGVYFIGKGILLGPQTWNIGELVHYAKRTADATEDAYDAAYGAEDA